MKQFSKPSRKSRVEPPGLDAFAEGALEGTPGAVRAVVPPPNAPTPFLDPPVYSPAAIHTPIEPAHARETLGMNVRFTPEQKAILVALAAKESRSQHQVLKRLLDPVLRDAAKHLGDTTP